MRRTFLGAAVALAFAPTVPLAQHGGHGGGSWPDHRDEPAQPSPPRRSPAPLPARPPRPPQVIIFVEKGGFWPRDFAVKRSEATEIFVLRRDDTCANELVIPKLGIRLPLPLGTPVQFRVQLAEADTIPFSCGDGDLGGVITVQ